MVGVQEKEKALFEAGIKLGAVFHQFIGTPVSQKNVDLVEDAIESCIKLQPHVKDAKVVIDRQKLPEKLSELEYTTIDEELLRVVVEVSVGVCTVKAVLEWDSELKYPLMKVESIDIDADTEF